MFFEALKNIGRFLTGKSYSIGIIGGADGPTAVYVSGGSVKLPIIIGVIVAVVLSVLVICKITRRK